MHKNMETIMLTLSFTLILSIIFLWIGRRGTRRGEAPLLLPPGKTWLPFIGETMEFVKSGHRGNPESFTLDRMKEFSTEVFKTSLMTENVVVCGGPSGNKFIFKNSNLWLPKTITRILVANENNNLDQSKAAAKAGKMVKEVLNQEYLQNELIDVMDSAAREQFAIYNRPQQVSASDLAKTFTFNLACRLFLSLDDPIRVKKLAELYPDITNGFLGLPINFPGTAFNRALKSSRTIRKDILSIVQQRKKHVLSNIKSYSDETSHHDKDMLTRLLVLTYGKEGKFPSDMIVVDMVMSVLVAGYDSTSSTLSCIVKHLTEHPSVYAQVLQEQMEIARDKKSGDLLNWDDLQKMKYTWCVAQEAMRLTPATQGAFREIEQDTNFEGFTIPKGWKTYWTVNSTHKNPKYFKNPEEFDPTRFEGSGPPPYTFVPFGGGAHICPGRQYAKIEILIFIHNLITRFHFEKILANEKVIYFGVATPANGLPIRLHPRQEQIS